MPAAREPMTVLRGLCASPGRAPGRAFFLPDFQMTVPQVSLTESEIDSQISRFDDAVLKSKEQITLLIENSDLSQEHKEIFESHLMQLQDPMIVDETKKLIRERRINSEWAFSLCVDSIKEKLQKLNNEIFRERAADLEDVANRILSNLIPVAEGDVRVAYLRSLPSDAILIAREIGPSLMLHIRTPISGIATQDGGITGHMAILARSRGIPALVGVTGLLASLKNQDDILLDAVQGILTIHPDELQAAEFYKQEKKGQSLSDLPVILKSKETISLWINADDESYAAAGNYEGVGLFRTEFLYMKYPDLAGNTEKETEIYSNILRSYSGKTVTFRLLDLGGDKLPMALAANLGQAMKEGYRGIRLLLHEKQILGSQLRAILRAAARTGTQPCRCRIMLPLVSFREEIEEYKKYYLNILKEIPDAPEVPTGIMLETPASCLMADVFSGCVDFFSLGTNDLAQFTLGLDRAGQDDSIYFQPALFRMIDAVLRKASVPVSICGEIASRTDLTRLLIGLGLRELSMSSIFLGPVAEIIRHSTLSECELQAREVLQAADADCVRKILERRS